MGKGIGLLDGMESVATAFLRHQVVEAVYSGTSCSVEVRLSPRGAVPGRVEKRGDRAVGRPGGREGNAPASRPAPARRCVLLRSPAVGIWHPAAGVAEEGRNGRPAHAGTVQTILGDEKVAAPRTGRLLVEIAEEASLVGFGSPLALWEVARNEEALSPRGAEAHTQAGRERP